MDCIIRTYDIEPEWIFLHKRLLITFITRFVLYGCNNDGHPQDQLVQELENSSSPHFGTNFTGYNPSQRIN